MTEWLVPVSMMCVEPSLVGPPPVTNDDLDAALREKKKTVRVCGDLSPGQAQGLACLKLRWKKFRGKYVRDSTYRLTRFGHPFNRSTGKCGWGCCNSIKECL